MCGIAGVVHEGEGRPNVATLLAMRDTLAHRGPDDAGIWTEGPAGLVHRRLSILDPSPAGHQPLGDPQGDLWVTYNGELYNYPELRELCLARGVALRGRSDTETLPHLWRFFGEDMVQHLRGMFAFALWDKQQRTLFLARDRFGQKPLYYAVLKDRFLFGSELKALRADDAFPTAIDNAALREYFAFGHVPDPRTIYAAARKLPPGHTLLQRAGAGLPKVKAYWQLRFAPEEGVARETWTERLEVKLQETVARHMISDVPLGAFLSGGVDSSTVVAFMAKASPRPIKTYTIGFDEESHSELPYARAVARHLGTDHTELVVRPDHCSVVERLAGLYDEPFADSSAVPTFLVSELARGGVTVALSGDGGDEVFAGYGRYIETLAYAQAAQPPDWLRRTVLRSLARTWPRRLRGKGRWERLAAGNPSETYVEWRLGLVRRPLARRLLSRDWTNGTDPFLRCEQEFAAEDLPLLQRMQLADVKTYLPGDILVKVDRASMAVGLETRAPLLDHELAELVARVPVRASADVASGKKLLKAVARRHLPPGIVDRVKMGFGIPLGQWIAGPLRAMVQDLLGPQSQTAFLYQRGALQGLLRDHFARREDHASVIWATLMLELFWRKCCRD